MYLVKSAANCINCISHFARNNEQLSSLFTICYILESEMNGGQEPATPKDHINVNILYHKMLIAKEFVKMEFELYTLIFKKLH